MSNAVITRKNKIKQYVESNDVRKRLIAMFGDEKKADKFKATLLSVALDSSLGKCNEASIVKSALMIAEAQLPISKQLGLAYIVPFGAEAQPIISYKGYKHLLRREGILVKAREVYSVDDFKMEFDGFDENFKLVVGDRKHNGKWIKEHLKGVWVVVKYKDLEEVENYFIPIEKLQQLANLSKAKNSKYSPYNTGFWLEMMLAKAVGYVARKIGVSGEQFEKVVKIENEYSELPSESNTKKDDEVDDVLDIEVEEIQEEELEKAK